MDEILPEQRRAKIVEWLQEEQSLTIDQLARHFEVSAMTIHRDLDLLVKEGRARKVRGGAMPAADALPAPGSDQSQCAMCGKRVPRRTTWVVTGENGEQQQACCPHCGFLMHSHATGQQSSLAADFLYGQMVNAHQATFVVGSEVTLCCVPGVLCFASRSDAERFQRGFGGKLLDFAGAMVAMTTAHHGH